MPVVPGTLLGRYHIISPLGAGGMGEVYLAQDTQLGRRVAIKFPIVKSDEHHTHARFLREARAVSVLSHRNIATIYDYGQTADGQPYLVMEMITGESLSDAMHANTLSLTRAVEVIADVAEALSEAHRLGIIHRDIKPSNVMIGERGEVKVLDFGLAKQIHIEEVGDVNQDAATLLATNTQSGIVVGTPLYLSPEQARSAPVDARSDIFALGALLYECITGRSAFSGKSVIEITGQIIHVDPPAPSTINARVPPLLDEVTLKALAKSPDDRYQSTEEMLAALREAHTSLDDADMRGTKRISSVKVTHPSALRTLSHLLQRPQISIGRLLLAASVLSLAILVLWFLLWRTKSYEASAEAKRWYEKGTAAMRDGAYDQASKSFLEAIKVDDQYALAHARLAEAWTELDYAEKAKDEMLKVNTIVRDRSSLPKVDGLYLDAITAVASRNFAHAITTYSEIARLSPEVAYVHFDLGRAYEKNDDITKAIESYVEATKRDSQYAPAFLRVGVLYGRKGEQPSAFPALDKAEMLYRSSGNFEGVTEVLYQRGLLFNRIGKTEEARQQVENALETARATNNLYQQIKSLLQLSVLSRVQGDTVKAKQLATQAIDLARASGLENLTTQGLLDLGNAYFAREEYDEAAKYFRQALEYAQRYNGRRNEARALLSLGSLLIQRDTPDEGLSYVQQALPFFQQGGYRRETSQALQLIARVQEMKGNYDAAFQALNTQLKLAEEVGDQPQMALLHSDIGTVLARQERYPEALAHFEKNASINSSIGKTSDNGLSFLNRGEMLWRLGRYEEAKIALSKAQEHAGREAESNRQLLSRIARTNGSLSLSELKYAKAIADSKNAIALDDTPTKLISIEAKYVLALAQTFSGSKQEGEKTCADAMEMAKTASDPELVFHVSLALAEIMLENGNAQGASGNALKAHEHFERAGQLHSEWRALVIAGIANQALNNRDAARNYLSLAEARLNSLAQKWGDDYYRTYLDRPDIKLYRQKLDKAFLILK